MAIVNELEIFYQLRSNMQILANSEKIDNSALENFMDAYILFSRNNKNSMASSADLAKKMIYESFAEGLEGSVENPQKLEKIKQALVVPELSVFVMPDMEKNFADLNTGLSLSRKLDDEMKKLKEQISPIEKNAITDLVKTAEKLEVKQKKKVSQQKRSDTAATRMRGFMAEEIATKLGKKAVRTEEENQVLENLDTICKIELQIEAGKEYLRVEVEDGAFVSLKLLDYKGGKLLGNGLSDIDKKNKVTEVYKRLSSGQQLEFFNEEKKSKKESKKREEIVLPGISAAKLNAEDKDLYQQEAKAYHHLLAAEKTEKAQELLKMITAKYITRAAQVKLAEFEAKQQDLKKITRKRISILKKDIEEHLQLIDNTSLMSMLAPAAGNNADEKSCRRKMENFLAVMSPEEDCLKRFRLGLVASFKNDNVMWDTVSGKYYKAIKEQARDPFYIEMAKDVLEGRTELKEVMKKIGAILSKPVAKLIMARSVELVALGQPKVTNAKEMDAILAQLGFRMDRRAVQVQKRPKLRSKLMTVMMRCLAEGRALDVVSLETKLNPEDKKYISENYYEFKKVLGADANFMALIGNQYEGKKKQEEPEMLTPYQVAYAKLGLLASISYSMNTEEAEKSLMEKVMEIPAGANIEVLKKKNGWNKDDYLFVNYMEIFLGKKLNFADKEALTISKENYDWEGFKKLNKDKGDKFAAEILENCNANNLAATLLSESRWPASLGNTSAHHNEPLKFSIALENPLLLNGMLVIAQQWKPWEDDPHQMEHMATLEGIEATAPYLLKTENGYQRRMQTDLRAGDVVCYEKMQVRQKDGSFADLIPEGTIYISSTGLRISEPKITEKALEYAKSVDSAFQLCTMMGLYNQQYRAGA